MSVRPSRFMMSLGLCAALSACGSDSEASGDEGEDTVPADGNVDEDAEIESDVLAACSEASEAELASALAITSRFDESLAELVSTGDVTTQLVDAVFAMTAKLVEGASGGEPPAGLAYVGKGMFQRETETTLLELWFTAGDDFTFAKRGEVIAENLLDTESYLVGMEVAGTPSAPAFSFEKAGPIYELLAPGAVPSSPLTLAVDQVSGLVARFRRLGVQGSLAVKDEQGGFVVVYDVELAGDSVADVQQGTLGYTVTAASATRGAQELVVTAVELGYDGVSEALVGEVTAESRGGAVEFDAGFSYASTSPTDITVSCI